MADDDAPIEWWLDKVVERDAVDGSGQFFTVVEFHGSRDDGSTIIQVVPKELANKVRSAGQHCFKERI